MSNSGMLYKFIKRVFDLVLSVLVVSILFVPGALLCIFVYFDTKGSPIYAQVRAGKNGKPFNVLKYRTMVADSDNLEKYLTPEQIAEWENERKVEDDPRVTPFGALLRKYSIDEFPQFINVILGQMSVIGPRAITFEELHHFGDDQELLLSVLPGITGEWQVSGRNDADFESGRRQELELDYVKNASLGRDLEIFFMTFGAIVKGTGK